MPAVTVTGAQWGDEGKGKVVDLLADCVSMVVRYQGGSNAGHAVVVGDRVMKLHLIGGLRSGMGYVGAANLGALRTRAHFIRITNAAFIEGHPHSVIITKEPPNYQVPPRQGRYE